MLAARAVVVATLVGLAPAVAHAGPTIAVMPFKNLSTAKASVGEAIRETVTTDLRAVAGLKLVERGAVDQILSEQNLVSQKADLDPTSTVKLGKLLGAQLIVAGAYQEVGKKVRLTARFVSVETGQIVGSTKVDGDVADFLALQDRISAELLKSAGITTAQARSFGRRPRPKVKSLKTLELYGDALLAQDDHRRVDMLRTVLASDPDFTYAAHDLEALEQRLKTYDAAHDVEVDREIQRLQASLDAQKDGAQYATALTSLAGGLMASRKYHAVVRLCRWVMASHPPAPPAGYPQPVEFAAMELVSALGVLGDWDGVLREGERFVAKYPASQFFAGVRMQMDRALTMKHQIEDGASDARDEIAKMSDSERANPCRTVVVYTRAKQWSDARRVLESMHPGQCLAVQDEFQWIQYAMAVGDTKLARTKFAALKARDPKLYTSLRGLEMGLPND